MLSEFRLSFESAGLYRSKSYPEFYAATTGPGMRGEREIRELLKDLMPDVIVNAGLAGMLLDLSDRQGSPQPGDLLRLSSIIDAQNDVIFPLGPYGQVLVTVKQPVLEPYQKAALAREHRARFCDMEGARLIQLMRNADDLRDETPIVFCKVVGDTPDHFDLSEHEQLVERWYRAGLFGRMVLGLKFPGGPLRMRKLLRLREAAVAGLATHTRHTVKALLGGVDPDSLGSVYAPA
ncbi:MAG: hypothetical protein K8S54_00845 [Spirochaetia bacterium]|nr:hypothetical protein [Spirochaetia bacterium]